MRAGAAVAMAALASAGSAWGYDANASKFTLIAVPDPQYYAVVQWKTDQYYNTQMNWIVANAGTKNIGFVFGLGDEVQDGNPYTTNASHQITTTYTGNITPSGQSQTVAGAPSIDSVDPVNHDFEAEWKRASNAWGILDNANIPNFPVAGNHDYYHWDQKKDPSEYVKYFGPSRYQGKSWYGGSSPVDTSQPANLQYAGLNSYSYFYAGGYKFLNIALQFNPVQGDLNWAQGVINANPGVPTIISTHDYQNTSGRDSAGNFIWNNFINKAGNDQIFMVLSGHVNGTHQEVSTNVDGKQVFEILSDYQDYTFGTGQGYSKSYANGGGFLRTMDFDLAANTINVQTYSPFIASQGDNGYLTTRSGTGANADAFTLSFNFAQRFGPPPFATGVNFFWDPGHTNGQNGGGAGTWDTSAGNWSNGTAANVAWDNVATNNTAIFGGAAGGTVTVAAAGVNANDVTFKTAGYTLGGGTVTFVGTSPTIDASAAGSVTVNNVLAGSAGLTVNGGRVTLSGANTSTGGLTVSGGGTVAFAADNNLGAAGGGVTLDGGTVSYTGNINGGLTQSRVYQINTNGGTFDVPNAGPTTPGSYGKLVLSGNNKVTGNGAVTKTGPGWLTVYGSNNGTGDWTINGGVVEAGNPGAIGGGVVNVTVNNGAELAANTAGGLANPITVNAGATIGADVNVTNTTTLSGAITAGGAFNVRLGNFWSGTSQNVVLAGKVSGTGALTVVPGFGTTTSAGKLTLAADNSGFTGGIVIPTGTVAAGLSGGKPLGTGAITLSGGRLALQGQLAAAGPVGALGPVAATGFNRDTIYADADTAKYPSGDSTNNTLMDGFFSYYQNGFTPGEGNLNQGVVLSGGIPGTAVTSAVNNTVTGTKTPFGLQSFTAANALQVSPGSPATLTLPTPAAFGNLSVLAVSSYGNNDKPAVTISFADGSSVTTTYNAYDWFVNADPTKVAADAFAGGLNRYSPTQSPGWDQRAFGMYETDIDLTNIGGVDYSTRPVVGLTFSAAYTDSRAKTNIFAVSGSARGWVTGGNQTYANAVNVTADSSIDVTTSLNATLGTLTIGANKLSVTSADTSGSPFSLAFGATAVNGNATFDVANSAGNGAGRLVLASVAGNGVITKAGAGTLRLATGGVIAGGLSITAGTVELGANATLKSLAVSGGKLDLLANNTVIDYTGTSPAAVVRSYLMGGRDGGAWDGAGIVSSTAAADGRTAIGYAEASQLIGLSGAQTAVWSGQVVDATSLLLMYTWYGDANLDGKVDADDYALIDRSFARHAGGAWVDGDFNYDGQVDVGDYLLIDATFGRQSGGLSPEFLAAREAQFGDAYVRELVAAVPEPASASVVGLAAAGTLMRRRRGR